MEHTTKSTLAYRFLVIFSFFLTVSCGGGGDDPQPPPIDNTSSLSGTITAPDANLSDGDVNDPNPVVNSNDSFTTAQDLFNPVTVGGYVNQPGTGATGQSSQSGDISDRYKVNLLQGQTINLFIADNDVDADGNGESDNDLDLYVFPADCSDATCTTNQCQALTNDVVGEIAASNQFTGHEQIVFNGQDQEVFIEVCSYRGASNYSLSIGAAASNTAFNLQQDFVPGQMIVKFKNAPKISSKSANTLSTLGLKQSGGSATRAMLVKMDQSQQRTRSLKALGLDSEHPKRAWAATKGEDYLEKWDTLNAIAKLNQRDDISYAEPNYIMQAQQVPADEFYSFQWHYPQINLPQAWDITTGSSDVIVAVIDTGVKLNHPDLANQLVAGYDFISDPNMALDGDGIDSNPDDPGDLGFNGQSSFHGTHVSGTVAANTNSANNTGVAGVAWQSKIMPIRVLGFGGGTSYDIMQGVSYAAGLPNDSNTTPAQRADIINLSLGGRGAPLQSAQDIVNQARNQGVIVIAAAGNENIDASDTFPASYDGVVAVSATDINNDRAPYSNFGATVDVAGPGGNVAADVNADGYVDGVLSTMADDTGDTFYTFENGTSMAAPHIAGVAALMKALHPGLTPAEFDNLLAAGDLTDDLGATGRDNSYGFGLINAVKAVLAAQEAAGGTPTPPSPSLAIVPSSLNFGTASNSLSLSVSNPADDGAVTGVTVEADQTYINASATNTDGAGLGTYQLTLDRSTLNPGSYSGNIVVQGSINGTVTSVNIPYIFQILDLDVELTSNVGYLYVILFDPATGQGIYQVDLAPDANGTYQFTFNDVVNGEYVLLAGSDFDNDGTVCDPSESCGIYPHVDSSESLINVNGDLSNLNFIANYEIGLTTASSISSLGPLNIKSNMTVKRIK